MQYLIDSSKIRYLLWMVEQKFYKEMLYYIEATIMDIEILIKVKLNHLYSGNFAVMFTTH